MDKELQSYYQELVAEENKKSLIIDCANYLVDYKCSLRDVAKEFMISKSQLHRDFHNKLKYYDFELYDRVIYRLHKNQLKFERGEYRWRRSRKR